MREDVPELDGHGHPKIVPDARPHRGFIDRPRPRSARLPVMAADGEVVGTVSDMWVDEPEQWSAISRSSSAARHAR